MIMRIVFLFVAVVVASPSMGETDPSADPALALALDALAARAEAEASLQYRLVCFEQVLRRVRRQQKGKDPVLVAGNATEMRRAVVVERGEDGELTKTRVRVNSKQEVRRGKGGKPIEADVPDRFEPIASWYPRAMAGMFGAGDQSRLRFEVLSELHDPDHYHIACEQRSELAVEFVDPEPPRKTDGERGPGCEALPSGQMCLDSETGEIERIVFYGLDRVDDVCAWDVLGPTVRVRQEIVEKDSRLRFASRIETEHRLDARETALFVQRFENCEFTGVALPED
jgi:hypothetical protein